MVACYVYVAIYWLSILYPVNCMFEDLDYFTDYNPYEHVSVDVAISRNTEDVLLSGGRMGAYSTVDIFTPNGASAFDIIKEGNTIIWQSNISQTHNVWFYHTFSIRLLGFIDKSNIDKKRTWNYYKKEWGWEWTPTDYDGFIKLRMRDYTEITVDISKSTSEDYVTVTDNSTPEYVNKRIEIHPAALVMEMFHTPNFKVYKYGNIMEQINSIWLYGRPNQLHCKVTFDIPGKQYDLEYLQMPNREWKVIRGSLTYHLQHLVMAPIPCEASEILAEGLCKGGARLPLPNTDHVSHTFTDRTCTANIGISYNVDHISCSGGKLGAISTVYVFTPIDISGFDIIKEGDELVWNSDTSLVDRITCYRGVTVRLLAFTVKSKDKDINTWNYYKKEWGWEWTPTDYDGFVKLRMRDYTEIIVDISKSTSWGYVTVTDNSTPDYVDKKMKIHPAALVMEVVDTPSFSLYKRVNLMEQCMEIWVHGTPDILTCTIYFDIPGDQYQTDYVEKPMKNWVPRSYPLSKELQMLVIPPLPSEAAICSDKRMSRKEGNIPLPNTDLSVMDPSDVSESAFDTSAVNIGVRYNVDHTLFSGGYLDEHSTTYEFKPIGVSGFNIIKDGKFVIWKSNTSQTRKVTYYIGNGVEQIAFKKETEDKKNSNWKCYKKEGTAHWKKIGYPMFRANRLNNLEEINVNLWEMPSEKYAKIWDQSTPKYVNKVIRVHPEYSVNSVLYTPDVVFYKRDNLMEQCRRIWLRGPPSKLHCKIFIGIPGSEYELNHMQMPDGVWEKLSEPLPEDLQEIVMPTDISDIPIGRLLDEDIVG
ncbi:hypothetical protein BdWA1_003452 [Babesia duncani]|uniref:Uncharacterized protein n=1 Tax=Babesia duncani TaxID=323732 RepID=A0AAD9PI54_9APIC|nr:hypothetical protein BdWA1_003452 [Babesia duncani]